jgi:hypothetical protein
MGLFNRIKDPVDAEYRLTSCSAGSPGAVYSNCRMEGVVTGPGIGPVAVEHSTLVAPTSKWPQPGQTIPVTVDREDPTRLKVRWDDLPTNRELGRQYAQQQAEQQAQQEAEVVGAPGRPQPGQAGGGLTPEQAAAGGGALIPATGKVLAVHEVVVPAGLSGSGAGGTTDLTLDISLPDGSGYSTSMRITFSTPEKHDAVAAVGRSLPVLVNPAAHDQVMIDTSKL